MATLFRRMPELDFANPAFRRPSLSDFEFAARPVVEQGDRTPPAVLDPFDEDWSVPVRGRLLDPRLQRAINAAARGWVIERFE